MSEVEEVVSNLKSSLSKEKDLSPDLRKNLAFEIDRLNFLMDNSSVYLNIAKNKGGAPLHLILVDISNRMNRLKSSKIDVQSNLEEIKSLGQSFVILKYLIQFTNIKKNIILCGANGVGKSTFVSKLKKSYLQNLAVIPAEKFLYYYNEKDGLQVSKNDFTEEQQQDPRLLKDTTALFGNLSKNILSRFTTALMYLVNIHLQKLTKMHSNNTSGDTVFDKVIRMFSGIFPYLELELNALNHKIEVKRSGSSEVYDLNDMSDGEKAVLYYVASVMLVDDNSYIVIDEPETYMNPVVYNKLWDLLQRTRQDCQFIFVSHSSYFIESRTNAELLWVKDFQYPDNWTLEEVPSDGRLSTEVTVALMGTRKPLLICEGDSRSYDGRIFSQIFMNEFSVLPVKGHTQVIDSTKAINRLADDTNRKAIGIIDGDGIIEGTGQVDSFKSQGIYVLPFNEIEMLLITDEVVERVLKPFSLNDHEVKDKMNKFKKAFFDKLNSPGAIDRMVINSVINRVNFKLNNTFVKRPKTLDSIPEQWMKTRTRIESDLDGSILKQHLTDLVSEEKYDDLLRYCNLKHEIVPALTDTYIDSNYVDKAMSVLVQDGDLCKELREKYFSEIV